MSRHSDFKIVLFHDDIVSGLRGSSVVERLADQLDMDADRLASDVWNFKVLLQPELRELAIARLLEANMIIISAAGSQPLPPHIAAWFESALALRADHDAAIVALLDGDQATRDQLPVLARYLEKVAEKFQFDFFCNKGAWQGRPKTVTAIPHFEMEDDFAAARPVAHWNSPGWGWGINE